MRGKLANGVGSQYSHVTSERGISSITKADAHTSAASSRLNWRPHRFKWTRPFRGKTKSGFCACAITFRTSYTHVCGNLERFSVILLVALLDRRHRLSGRSCDRVSRHRLSWNFLILKQVLKLFVSFEMLLHGVIIL